MLNPVDKLMVSSLEYFIFNFTEECDLRVKYRTKTT